MNGPALSDAETHKFFLCIAVILKVDCSDSCFTGSFNIFLIVIDKDRMGRIDLILPEERLENCLIRLSLVLAEGPGAAIHVTLKIHDSVFTQLFICMR